jgi:hypothetical protein
VNILRGGLYVYSSKNVMDLTLTKLDSHKGLVKDIFISFNPFLGYNDLNLRNKLNLSTIHTQRGYMK